MKTAKMVTAAVYLDCPVCGENIAHPDTGSFLWSLDDPVKEKALYCQACTTCVKLPKKLIRKES